MTDYLSALAQRALAPREVLQPRLPGRFESMISEVVAPSGEYAASWQEREAGVLERREMQREQPIEQRPRIEATDSPTDDREASPLQRRREWRRDATRPAGETPALPLPARPPSEVLRQSAEMRPATITIDRKGVDKTIENETIDTPPAATALTSKPRQAQPPTRTTARESAAPSRVVERLRVRRDEPIVAHTTAPAPVEITIGRIDVRAVVAAQPPASRAKPQPRILSLDEYAAKREGRGK